MARGQNIILFVVAAIVLGSVVANSAGVYMLLTENIARYRAFAIIVAALSAILDILFLVLVYMLFEEIHRGQREAERLQAFMDNVYRRNL